ncbi:Bacteriophage P22, NinX [uncultured Caudovirales phage]|uniref:Bacteriophage P22, NinX n=1 Tax=uncultured Caudovirales phage TaxID=2100421 RepID=A0A6J7WQ32_9CAUD|nr:Bacteriophage P22, NinX [uncultured Caudovirales phage]
MKIKTSELTGAALDWAVAKCAGLLDPRERYGKMVPSVVLDMEYWSNGDPMVRLNPCPDVYYRAEYDPSTNWEHGGPIIEREKIEIFMRDEEWYAASCRSTPEDFHGDTPLIAAMRCYVASEMGDEVDVPKELL